MKATKSKYLKNKKALDFSWGLFMIAPTMIGLFLLNIFPIFQTFYLSLTKTGTFGKSRFIGFQNYIDIFKDKMVMQSFANTFTYTIIVVPLGVFLSLVIAVLLNSKIKGKTIYRTLFFLPVVSAPAAVAMVWRWLFNSKFGLVNNMISSIGLKGPDWLLQPSTAMFAIIVVGLR